jgi:cation diffusion facilitator family transporter
LEVITEGFRAGQQIAKFGTLILAAVGLVEFFIGQAVNSLAVWADGVHSLADSIITGIVWLGLRLSWRRPDEKFHFGYLKVESLAALAASLGMIAVGSYLAYVSYLGFMTPRKLTSPLIAVLTLISAGSISLYVALRMRSVAKKRNLVSLKAAAHNLIKNGTASFIVLAAVLGTLLGFTWMDAIGSLIIAVYIVSVAFSVIRESTLALVDAFNRPELAQEVRRIIERNYPVEVKEVKLRRTGPYIESFIDMTSEGSMTIQQASEIEDKIKDDLRKNIDGLGPIYLTIHAKNTANIAKP